MPSIPSTLLYEKPRAGSMEICEPGWKNPTRNRDPGRLTLIDDWSPNPKMAAASMPYSVRVCAAAGVTNATTAVRATTHDEMMRMNDSLLLVSVAATRASAVDERTARSAPQNRCAFVED